MPVEEEASGNPRRADPFFERQWATWKQGYGCVVVMPARSLERLAPSLSLKFVLHHHPHLLRSLVVRRPMYSPGQLTLRQDRRDNRPRSCIIPIPEKCVRRVVSSLHILFIRLLDHVPKPPSSLDKI